MVLKGNDGVLWVEKVELEARGDESFFCGWRRWVKAQKDSGEKGKKTGENGAKGERWRFVGGEGGIGDEGRW